jgi:DNA-binding HxlR family transcriptional regulator
MDCSIARALDVVGEWWTLLIVRDIGLGEVHRFEQLQQNLGIARNVLTVRLQKLVDHGIVETRLYQHRPERFEYHLTAKGRDLAQVLYALLAWGDRWTREGSSAPLRFEHAACGQALVPALACPECDVVAPAHARRVVRHPLRRESPAVV